MPKPSVLLAYGEKEFSRGLQKALGERNYAATILSSGPPPRASYDFILQLSSDPTDLTEGTRQLLEKIVKDRARFFLVAQRSDEQLYGESLRFAESLTRDFERRFGLSVNILRLGRLFGPKHAKEESGALGFLIHEFAEGEVLTVYGDGEEKDYYLYVDDAYEGISQALAVAEEGITYAIAPKVSTSALSIAKLLSELGKGRHEIHYHRGLVALEEQGPVGGEPLPKWREKVSLRDGVMEILKNKRPQEAKASHLAIPHLKLPAFPKARISFKKPSPTFLKLSLFILLLLSPLIYLGAEAAFAFWQLGSARSQAAGFNFAAASSAANSSAASFERIERWEKIIPLLGAAGVAKEVALGIREATANGDGAAVTLENFANSRQGLATIPQTQEHFRALAANFSAAEDHLILATIEADKLASPFPQDFIQTVKNGLKDGLLLVRLGKSFWGQAYDLLGYEGERTYLILFENSTEARSAGGFLGSLAQLNLEAGGIKKLEFFDSYKFDSAGTLPLPPAFAHFFKQGTTLLREASVYPSFPKAAGEVARIFGGDQNTQVHGVVGATLIFAQELLRATGGLKLTEPEKLVTADNLFPLATEEVEKDFFPGSTKKKRFMQALGEGLIEKLFSLEKSQYAAIAQALLTNLKERNLLLYFQNGQLAQALLEAGFDGRILASTGDYLAVLDSNYSAKVNGVFVKRSLNYRVLSPDKEGHLRGDLTITWHHTGTDAWPSASYSNLLLVLVPKGSTFLGAKLNGNDYYDTFVTEEEGKTELAAYFPIPHSSVTTFEFIYALPGGFDFDTLETYELAVQKQPGTQGDDFSFVFEKTFGDPPGGDTMFDGKLDQDLNLRIQLTEK